MIAEFLYHYPIFIWLTAAILGLSLGSFIACAAYRLPRGLPIWHRKTRSSCGHCQRQLVWFELIPVLSFLFLKGRCRTCGQPIGWYHVLIELGTLAITFGITALILY
jgi:leader peptidase (prepilin peptidase)/N-methyltransferase